MTETLRKTQGRLAARELRRRRAERQEQFGRLVPWALVGALVLIGLGLLVYGQIQSAPPTILGVNGPRLQLDREQVALGDRHFGTTVRAVFTLTNTGDGTLIVNAPKVATAVQGC